jgi:hypothetical protein
MAKRTIAPRQETNDTASQMDSGKGSCLKPHVDSILASSGSIGSSILSDTFPIHRTGGGSVGIGGVLGGGDCEQGQPRRAPIASATMEISRSATVLH